MMDKKQQNSPHVGFRRRYRRKPVVKDSEAHILKESVKTVSKEYCADSSICGLKHLVSDETPLIERIIWVVTLIGALVCSVSLVMMTFNKFYRAPLVTTQLPEGVPVSTIIFPAVGICSNNRISKKAVTKLAGNLLKEKRNQHYTKDEMINLLYGLGRLYQTMHPVHHEIPHERLHRALGDYDVNDLLKSLTPQCEDLLLNCSWNEVSKNCTDIFDFRLTSNGYCCTFNYLRSTDKFEDRGSEHRNIDMYKFGNQSTFDFDQGLKVLLNLDGSDDFFYNVPLQGAQLQFSDAYDFPDAPSGDFALQIISRSVQMTVMVTASFTKASRDIQHIPVSVRGCLFYDESSYLPFYTSSDCLLKCRMQFLRDKCNCTPFNMPKIVDTRTCDMRDVRCLRRYYAQSINVRPDVDPVPRELELELVGGGIRCPMCHPTCSKTAYSYNFINVNIYPDQLNTVPDKDRMEWLRGANFTGTSIVHVKYARGSADCFGQNIIMKWFDLISNIGSTCGFVTGFSFVSVLEFIYFFTIKLARETRARRQEQKRIAAIQYVTPPERFQPITRYTPIYWNEIGGSSRIGQKSSYATK
ncbi:hypothetical protein O0L34_g5984 [Tuta absoluta]|nr:hypothetical protein O0L34_g5984 [Tuta absoluta]